MTWKVCQECGKSFYVSPKRDKTARFCSKRCYGDYRKKHPEEFHPPPLQGKALIFKCTNCGKDVYVKGEKRKNQERHFCSRKCFSDYKNKNPEIYYGEKHWNWQGGKTDKKHKFRNSPEYKEWRRKVFKRDNWTCQDCGYKGKFINAHHIKNIDDYPELALDVDNGLTLCDKCHKKRHPNIGIRNRFKKGLTPKNKIESPPKDELKQLYITKKLGSPTIGEIYGVCHTTVLKWLDFYDIPRRKDKKHYTGDIPIKEELQKLYIEEKEGVKAISEIYGVHISTVSKWLKKHQIPTRPFQGR